MHFRGLNGTIEVMDNALVIKREKMLDGFFHEKGSFTIPFSAINRIHFIRGGLTNGYLALERRSKRVPRTVFTALNNDDVIIFRMTKNEEAEAFSDCVNRLIRES